MNQLKYIFIFSFLFCSITKVYSSQDFYEIKRYGNVIVRIKSGDAFEEINKALIIGRLAEKLSKKLKYSKTIFLHFNHFYTGNCTPNYFISFDKGKVLGNRFEDGKPEEEVLKQNSIVIRQASSLFDAQITLKLIEYAIKNVNNIQKNQQLIFYEKNYCSWEFKTINQATITTIINTPNTNIINDCLNTEIKFDDKTGISYYFKNDCFTLFYKSKSKKQFEIINLKTIYYIERINSETQIVFETKKSFYYIAKNKISKKQYIPSPRIPFVPYNIEKKGKDNISFFYYYTVFTGKSVRPTRTLKKEHIYSITKDKLVI
ncbi:hypothetical protein [Flavobacterium sp.]|uniref:hypothetical protein n=1 Tax=Flavobacterium sp. TaxID=239 RepID=UPI003D6B8F1F